VSEASLGEGAERSVALAGPLLRLDHFSTISGRGYVISEQPTLSMRKRWAISLRKRVLAESFPNLMDLTSFYRDHVKESPGTEVATGAAVISGKQRSAGMISTSDFSLKLISVARETAV